MLIDLKGHAVDYFHCFAPISQTYDAFLIDIWGVLHDNAQSYPGAVDCLHTLKQHGKKIILVSNAGRRSSVLARELLRFGITDQSYDHLVSSGEVTWSAFSRGENNQVQKLGKTCFLLGAADNQLTEGLALKQTEDLAGADFILTAGVTGNPSSIAADEPVLLEAVNHDLIMVCANPDLQVVRNGVMGIAAGALAKRYEELGGKVIYFGKPHRAVYQRCFELLTGIRREQILAVGDALHTDVAGANQNGIDSALVATGIHAGELSALPDRTGDASQLCQRKQLFPKAIVKAFRW